ncbi:hypothetical protein ACUNHI_27830, partial [Serratia sp. IR-2025]
MTLTTEQLRARAESLGLDFFIERRTGIWVKEWLNDGCTSATAEEVMMWSMLANREAQPVAGELGEIRVGRLPTMNQEEYPGLGDWWVQLRIGASGDEILARVYGATPDEAVARALALTA